MCMTTSNCLTKIRLKKLEAIKKAVRIYSEDIEMEYRIEKCTKLINKSRKWHLAEGIELPNQERFRIVGEKKTYWYLGLLEADTIKQPEMEKNTLGEQENYLKPNYIAEISSKEGIYGRSHQ